MGNSGAATRVLWVGLYNHNVLQTKTCEILPQCGSDTSCQDGWKRTIASMPPDKTTEHYERIRSYNPVILGEEHNSTMLYFYVKLEADA